MDEATLNKITLIFIVLVTFSAHHFYFGKNIPKWSWRLSIALSIAAGMYFGFSIALFPSNIILSIIVSTIVFLINLVVRTNRNREDTFFESDK